VSEPLAVIEKSRRYVVSWRIEPSGPSLSRYFRHRWKAQRVAAVLRAGGALVQVVDRVAERRKLEPQEEEGA